MSALTAKQEAFCLAYAETGNASEAYRRAYDAGRMKPETVHRKAAELMRNGKITARIEALQAAARSRNEVTVDRLTAAAIEALEMAKAQGHSTAMVRALEYLARLHGLNAEAERASAQAEVSINIS